jgi:hypothetical protein
MPARKDGVRPGPGNDEVEALDDLARRVQSALEDRPVVFGVLERSARIRFWGSPPEGGRPPAGSAERLVNLTLFIASSPAPSPRSRRSRPRFVTGSRCRSAGTKPPASASSARSSSL